MAYIRWATVRAPLDPLGKANGTCLKLLIIDLSWAVY